MCDLGLELAKSTLVSCMDSREFRERRVSRQSRSSPAWEFRERRFAASKVEVRLEGSRVHTYLTETAHSARLIPRSTGSHRRLVAVNERRGKARRARRRPPTGASDSGRARKASYGARRRLRGAGWPRARTGGGRRNARRLSTEGAARPRARSLVEGRCALTAVVTPWPSATRLQTCGF